MAFGTANGRLLSSKWGSLLAAKRSAVELARRSIELLPRLPVNVIDTGVAADEFFVLLIVEQAHIRRPFQFARCVGMVGIVANVMVDLAAGSRGFFRVDEHGVVDVQKWIVGEIRDE